MSEEPTRRPRRGIPDDSIQPGAETADGSALRTAAAEHHPDDTPAPAGQGWSRSSGESADGPAPRRGLIPDDDPATDTPEQDTEPESSEDGKSSTADPDAAFRPPAGKIPRARSHRTGNRRTATPAADRPHRAAEEPGSASPDELVVDRSPLRRPWVWAVIAVLVVAIVVVAVSRLNHQSPITGASVTPTPSSVTPLPQDSLMSAAEVSRLDTKASWKVDDTLSTIPADSTQTISCIVRDADQPTPQSSWQRSFTASTKTATAALHRADGYADEATAKSVYTQQAASLAACDSVPSLIVSASSVKGLGDEATSLTVAFQGTTIQYRTIVLTRIGREIQAIDASDNHTPIDATAAASAITAAASRGCRLAGGTCPGKVTVSASVPPTSDLPGWLITSDLPRLTPDQGEWQAAAPAGVSSKGTQCEGVTLASASGPRERQQRTYLLYKDSSAPQGFGVDSLRFGFGDAAGAAAFAKKIGDSIASCSKSLTTAKVSDAKSFTGVGEKGAKISGRSFLVTQDAGSGNKAVFQVSVSTVGSSVTYLLANVTTSYRFTDDAWSQLAVRAAERATQAR